MTRTATGGGQAHRTPYRVIYGDTDAMGVAYYANYLRWFEIGRTELFRALGKSYRELEAGGVILPVSEAHCRYLHPARYDDVVLIETRLDAAFRAGLKFEYRLLDESGHRVIAEGWTRHACVTPEGRVIRPPAALRDLAAAT